MYGHEDDESHEGSKWSFHIFMLLVQTKSPIVRPSSAAEEEKDVGSTAFTKKKLVGSWT